MPEHQAEVRATAGGNFVVIKEVAAPIQVNRLHGCGLRLDCKS